MTTEIDQLTGGITRDLARSLDILQTDISRVEQELDLEVENLGDLLDRHHPDINRQLGALCNSIGQLHRSLDSVRSQLAAAQSGSADLRDAMETARREALEARESGGNAEAVPLSGNQAEAQRHSDRVSLGSIVRALLMADEPAQREISGETESR